MKGSIRNVKIVLFLAMLTMSFMYYSSNIEASGIQNKEKILVKKGEFQIQNGVLLKYSGKKSEVTIPDGVTVINDNAFAKNQYVEKVIFPESIKELGDGVFAECTYLEKIVFSSNLRKMGKGIFKNCESLSIISWPILINQIPDYTFMGSGLTKFDFTGIERIGKGAFMQTKIKNVMLPDSVRRIEEMAFGYCSNLKEIHLSDSLEEIPNSFCINSQVGSIFIPASVKRIDDMAFAGSSQLNAIYGGENVEQVGQGVFYNTEWTEKKGQTMILGNVYMKNDGMDEKVIIPEGITMIYHEAFLNNQKIRQVEIPSSVQVIGDDAFSNCKKLDKVELKKGLLSIGENAFRHCIALEEISFPVSLEEIKSYAFAECKSLAKYQFPKVDIEFGSNVFYGVEQGNAGDFNEFIVANNDTLIAYVDFALEEELRIPSGVKRIGKEVFQTHHIIGTLYIPGTVEQIEIGSFEYPEIANIVLEEGVKEIKNLAFYHCITDTITIPNSVEKIDSLLVWKTNVKDVKVICKKNSFAYQYAKKNSITIQLQFY